MKLTPYLVCYNNGDEIEVTARDRDHAEHLTRVARDGRGPRYDRGPAWSIVDLNEFPMDGSGGGAS